MYDILTDMDDLQLQLFAGVKALGAIHTGLAEGVLSSEDVEEPLYFVFSGLHDLMKKLSDDIVKVWKEAGFNA